MRITDVCLIGQEDAGYRALVRRRIAERNAARCNAVLSVQPESEAASIGMQAAEAEEVSFQALCSVSGSTSAGTTEERTPVQVLPSSGSASVISACCVSSRPTARAAARHAPNLLYRLDPVRAYDLGLVKRIEVDSVLEDADFNKPYISVKSISATRANITAKIRWTCRARPAPCGRP